MNTVTYIYDGHNMTTIVNGNVHKEPLNGNILRRQTGIVLGAGSRVGFYQGKLDDVSNLFLNSNLRFFN